MSTTVVAIPGFLGVPDDWKNVVPGVHVPALQIAPYHDWARQLNTWATSLPGPRILAGYSLGGRLALHALIDSPTLWDAAVIVSAHPGLSDEQDKAERFQSDLEWAELFRTMPWEPLMTKWNSKGALKSSPGLSREESDYNREDLARMLDVWSLGRQDNLIKKIGDLDIPILWMVGERDTTFRQIAETIKFKHLNSRVVIVAEAGHRLLHEAPEIIIKEWPWKQ